MVVRVEDICKTNFSPSQSHIVCIQHMSHVLIFLSIFLGPMTEWHQAALVALQGNLKLSLKMFQLSYMLEKSAGGFMDRAEVLKVKAKAGDMEQMGELISILLGKEDMAFYSFCDLLQRSNYEVWARKLKSEAERFKTEGMLNTFCLHIVAESGYR